VQVVHRAAAVYNGEAEACLAPLCVGIPGTAKGRIPKAKLLELNEKTKGKLGTFVSFGYSQWSGMQERTGRAPLCLNGIHLNIVPRYAPKKVGDAKKTGSDAGGSRKGEVAAASDGKNKATRNPIPGLMGGSGSSRSPTAPARAPSSSSSSSDGSNSTDKSSKIPPIFGTASSSISSSVWPATSQSATDTKLQIDAAVAEFTRLMRKGVTLQCRRMGDFYASITTDTAAKMTKSGEKLVASSGRVRML
jgi:hypothetical protein